MPGPTIADIEKSFRADLSAMSSAERDAWGRRGWELALRLARQLNQDSTNSSRPPSSDSPYKHAERRAGKTDDTAGEVSSAAEASAPSKKKPGRRPGKQPGAPGFWRKQPLVATGEEIKHLPAPCSDCANSGVEKNIRMVSAHYVYELERGSMELQITARKHCYYAITWDCGHETIAEPGVGLRSEMEGRKRDLQMSERRLVGPMLATFIAALALRYTLSREKVAEFLSDWLGFELSAGAINLCIHEFGCASEPVVEELLEEVQTSEMANVDETPWWENGRLLWMWVVVTNDAVIYHIGGRCKEELVKLIGETYLGWLISDGYCVYRSHPRRQRCLAHLIRKAKALVEGAYGDGSDFGKELLRDLRRLIKEVAEGGGSAGDSPFIKRLIARIKWSCQRNKYEEEEKVRQLAREILNDWDAVIAFVDDPRLPPTNNDAERALRHVVIARRISFGTRTDEGSRFYAASLSVIATCRKRGVDPWVYGRDLIAAARKGAPLPKIPSCAKAAQDKPVSAAA